MSSGLDRLVEVMARLRDKEKGCPWDLEQTFVSLVPHTLEEVYELAEAIETNNSKAIKEELGDVLFQIAFYAQIAKEKGLFDMDQVATAITDKMVERHSHVFSDRKADTSQDVLTNWEADKEAKRKAEALGQGRTLSVLEGVSTALPATTRAVKLQKRAARVGFDWSDVKDVLAKIEEEVGELKVEIEKKDNALDRSAIEDELGDVFFALTNLARKLDIDPEVALRQTNRKFERRFHGIEKALVTKGRTIHESTLEEMERLWNDIKKEEKAAAS